MTTRAAAADDFGHLVHQTPDAVLLPASAQEMATAVRRHFGAAFGRLGEAKHERDPEHLLTPGYEVFS
ncbi:MAG TPA: hypothetical protein VJ735_05475 [Actinomycetes bacterium]|nr:hypothetical protein [Actinomycetes bacterium]